MEPITLLVLDPMPIVAWGIANLLASKPWFKVVGVAGSVGKALDLAKHLHPRLVLTEVRLSDGDAARLISGMQEASPASRVVVLTTSSDEADVLRLLRAGAHGYLLKAGDPDGIVRDLRQVARGEPVVAGAAAMTALLSMTQLRSAALPMTPREMEVLTLLAGGLSNRDMAQRLQLTEHTVKRHVHSILDKLGLNNRAEAAAFAVAQGLADPPAARVGWNRRDLALV